MESRKSLSILRVFAALILTMIAASVAVADDDPNPDSPTPVLLSYANSTRALAVEGHASKRIDLNNIPERAFQPDSTLTIFVANLTLMEGEGANAFRVYAQDAQGHYFRFPVTAIEPYRGPGARGMYSMVIQLTDQAGYWTPPTPDGDLLLQVTWRGLGSNRVRLGLGRTGGGPADDAGAMPSPPGAVAKVAQQMTSDDPLYVGYKWSGDRMRFLEQATFGPTKALDNRIRRIGLRTWLNEQLSTDYPDPTGNCTTYPTVSDPMAYPCQPIKTENVGGEATCDGEQTITPDVPVNCYRDTYSMYQPQTWFFRQAYYGDAQLRHRVAWALGQIWVTSAVDIQQGRYMVEWHKILSRNAFGNYRTLMRQMTLDPTMGDYLSMRLSTRNSPNENYAREIMQLFTVGLFLLNQDGTLKLDGQGNPIPTYDQNGVNNLTKVFTGWKLCNSVRPECPNYPPTLQNYIDPMIILNRNEHDLTAKTLLSWPADPNFPPNNTNIPACSGCTGTQIDAYASTSLDQALDNMFYHPNTGPFVSRILIQHLVTSDPTPAYVGRVAAVFNNNGLGVRGDLKAVIKAILLDPEARGNVKTDPFYGKLREPVLYTTNFMRAFNVRSADGAGLSEGYIASAGGVTGGGRGEFNGMAQIPFFSPTVFNFYPPSYIVPGTSMNGPEFAILTTGTAIQRTNFMNRFVYTPIPIPVALPNVPNGTSLDFSDLQALEQSDTTNGLLLDELSQRMLHGTMSAQMKTTISTACNAVTLSSPPTSEQLLNRVRMAVYLVGTSSQYQVQR